MNGVPLLFGLQIISTVCSSDLVVGVSSLCVWRCGRLLVYRLSGWEVQWSPLYRLLPHTGPPWMRPGYRHGLISYSAIEARFKEVARVDLGWPPAQLPDLVQTRWKAQNGLHILLQPNLRPPTSNQRLKCDFHRGWPLFSSLQGVEYVPEGGGRGLCPGWSGVGEGVHNGFLITCFWEEEQKVQMVPMHYQHGQGRRSWNLLPVVSGPWTSFVAALEQGPMKHSRMQATQVHFTTGRSAVWSIYTVNKIDHLASKIKPEAFLNKSFRYTPPPFSSWRRKVKTIYFFLHYFDLKRSLKASLKRYLQ